MTSPPLPHPTIIPYLTLPLVEGGGPKFYKLAYLKQCLQLKIRTKNVKNQTKIGPNFSEKSDLMELLPEQVPQKIRPNPDFSR